jgi:hypothetical protein
MNRYAVLNDNVVVGFVSTRGAKPADSEVSNFDTVVGDIWNPVTQVFSSPFVEPPTTVPLFPIAGLTIVDSDGAPILFANAAYQPDKNQHITITANIVDENGVVQTDKQAAGLKVIFTRMAGRTATTDQELLKCSIENGVLTIEGSIGASGVWLLVVENNNAIMQALGYDFGIDHPNIELWV